MAVPIKEISASSHNGQAGSKMIFDMMETTLEVGMIPFPDFPYALADKQPGAIKETSYIHGNNTNTASAGGNVDDPK